MNSFPLVWWKLLCNHLKNKGVLCFALMWPPLGYCHSKPNTASTDSLKQIPHVVRPSVGTLITYSHSFLLWRAYWFFLSPLGWGEKQANLAIWFRFLVSVCLSTLSPSPSLSPSPLPPSFFPPLLSLLFFFYLTTIFAAIIHFILVLSTVHGIHNHTCLVVVIVQFWL